MSKPCDNCIWLECEEYGKICPFYEEETEARKGEEADNETDN